MDSDIKKILEQISPDMATQFQESLPKLMESLPKLMDSMPELMNSLPPNMSEMLTQIANNPNVVNMALKKMNKETPGKPKKIIHITSSRKIKSKTVTSIKNLTSSLLIPNPMVINCPKLSLNGKIIKIWYDPQNQTKNRTASKLIGITIGGHVIIEDENGDLSLQDFNDLIK